MNLKVQRVGLGFPIETASKQPRAVTWRAAIGNPGFITVDLSNQIPNNCFVDIPNAHQAVLQISPQRTGGDGFDELSRNNATEAGCRELPCLTTTNDHGSNDSPERRRWLAGFGLGPPFQFGSVAMDPWMSTFVDRYWIINT